MIVLFVLSLLLLMLLWSRVPQVPQVSVPVVQRVSRPTVASAHREMWLMPNLAKRRTWYADGDGDGDDDPPPASGANGDIDLSALDPSVRAYIEQQQQRIKELNDESASRRIKLKQVEEERAAERADYLERLEQTGEYKKLADERAKELARLKLEADRAESLEAQIQAANEVKIGMIPEDYRDVVPELPPEKLSVWLDKNLAKFTTPKAPDLDGAHGTGGGKTVKLTPEQESAFKLGDWESKAEYIEYMKRAGLA